MATLDWAAVDRPRVDGVRVPIVVHAILLFKMWLVRTSVYSAGEGFGVGAQSGASVAAGPVDDGQCLLVLFGGAGAKVGAEAFAVGYAAGHRPTGRTGCCGRAPIARALALCLV